MLKFHFANTLFIKTAFLFCLVGASSEIIGKEGMWLPSTLKSREADMIASGLKIPVELLYNEAGTGLNNAVVLFGSGCTAELISSKGLLLTNHHCGYGTVQGISSRENDYFAHGFWAMNNKEEIPCPGLKVTFVRKMENVTEIILADLADTTNNARRDTLIAGRIRALEKGYKYTTKMDATIRTLYNGNQYWVFITETYTDVRLVGFPPNGIGQFGGDTDNWMWPRHTGDFSMFRIYSGKNNKPAEYSPSNKPYDSRSFFPINISGYKEGDFTMVYGFPAVTQEYISSFQLNQIYNIIDPIRINSRTKKLNVWTKHMTDSRDVFLKYTSKRASVANGWKKWQGEIRGLRLNNVLEKKRQGEKDFQDWAGTDDSLPYADDLLTKLLVHTTAADSALKADVYIQEAVLGIELIQQAAVLDRMIQLMRMKLPQSKLSDTLQKLISGMESFYKNFDLQTDKELFTVLFPEYINNGGSWVPPLAAKMYNDYHNDATSMANDIYSLSFLADKERLKSFAASATIKDSMRLLADPAWRLYKLINDYRRNVIGPALSEYNKHLAYLNRLYMQAQMKKDWNTTYYPDANQTLRLSYGKVEGMDPDGPADYSYQTNLDEVIKKDNPSVEEFKVPEKLKTLYQKKDYGRWKVNGTVPLAFIASNHTSGGNSGSPVLNAKGQLIGTNFDRVWEGTMSDLYFDPKLCRNISVDIRYTLFIIEKFGGAGWLLKEMKLVR
jgi:hypothetical protein